MAKDTAPVEAPAAASDSTEWETINTGNLGEEWDFDRDGALDGSFLGSQTVATQKVDSGEATAYQFAPTNSPDEVVFIWKSSELSALDNTELFRVGDRVRITFLGREQFTGGDGKPRQVKRYRIQVPKHVNS